MNDRFVNWPKRPTSNAGKTATVPQNKRKKLLRRLSMKRFPFLMKEVSIMRAHSTNFRVVSATDKAEIFLYDVIGADFFGGITAKMFADELNSLGNVKSIDVRINSPGGDVFEGFTMFSLLKSHKAKVNVFVDGLAASIASVIAMAGDTIEVASNGYLMIHNPWSFFDSIVGDANEMRSKIPEIEKKAALLDKIRDSIVDTYASRANIETEELKALMDAETWFNSSEAVANGFADVAGTELAVAACLRPELLKFHNMPRALLENTPPEPTVSPLEALETRIREKLTEGRKHDAA